ncbi:uncharacterized protein LOC128396267 [Panonychus citri]|uniref:uncharacterized protein LOC128396267 n=1 Tax=Panonychus citri TaxID=50023 RepID=UPI00230703EB|nr:uncharacterized protein LOC128396267 [Panonychus citri]
MEEGGDPIDKKETEMENEDAEEGEIIDDDEEDESQLQQQQQLQSTTTTPTTIGATTFTNSSSLTSTSTAFSFGNQGDKSGSGLLISGLSTSSASGNNSTSRSSERNKKDENRSSSKKSDSKKSNNSTNSGSSTGTSNTNTNNNNNNNNNNNSTSGAGTSSSSRNNSSDKRKRRKYGKDEDGKDQGDKESGSSKDHSDDNGLRPSKQRRAASREPGEANDTGSSDESDRTDSDDDSLDFNEEFFKGMVKQMEEMLKSGKDKGQRKKREKIEKMMEKLKRLQSGSDPREMREIVRQNRRLFRPSSRDRSRDRFDRFGQRGFRDRRGRGGRMRERTMDRMIWRERDRDRRDFRDRDRDRDRDRFRDRDKMMGIDQSHHHHHHHHHQSHSSNQSQSQQLSQSQQQSTQSPTTTTTNTTTTVTSTTDSTLTTTTASILTTTSPSSTTPISTSSSSPSTTTTTTSSSSQNPSVIPQNQSSKENDREREKSPKNTCRFYLDGKCHKGAECPFPHDSQPAKKKDICKFYLQGFCGKGDGCLFMHGEFPCKFYHTGAECYSGDKCRFSHEPLTEETRALLKSYLDSGELPDEVNRGDSNHSRAKKPAILGDPTEEMKTSYLTWLWQQEMKELELAYTGTKRNLFLIEKEFAIIEQPPQPEGDPHPYYRNDKMDMMMRQGPEGGGGGGGGPKVMSYYIDTMSDQSKCDPISGPVNEDDKLIEMSFHDEDLRLPPSSGIIPPRLPPPMGAPGPAPVDSSSFPGLPPDHLSSLPPHHLPNLNSSPPSIPFDSQALISSTPSVHSNNSPSSLTTMIPSGPPPLLPMQPKLINANNEHPSSFSTPSFVNNNQYSIPVMPEEMPLPPLKENLPPGPYQESTNLGPPPPLYAVNSFNGPQPVVPIESIISSSSLTSNQPSVNLSSIQSAGHDNINTNQLGQTNFNPISHNQQFSSSFASPQDTMESTSSIKVEHSSPSASSSIPDNLPLAARHLLQRISNNQKIGTPEDSESNDLLFNESNIKKEKNDSDLGQSSDQMIKPLDVTSGGEMKQLLSDSDDDTEDEPVKAALKNLKDAPNTTPPPMKHESKKDKNVKSKLDIVKMLNVIRQTTLQVTQPAANTSDENKHADFWQNILSGTNLANNSSAATLTVGSTGSNSGIDFRDSLSGTPPLPGTERRDPRLKRSSNDDDGNSPFQDFTSSNKPSEPAFKSDFDYRLHPITAPKIDYSMYEGLFNTDVRMKTDPRLLNFFKKNTLKDYNPLG